MTEEVDLSNYRPCPVCMRVLTDQPLCHYCQETATLREEIVKLKRTIDLLREAAHPRRFLIRPRREKQP